MDDDSGNNNNNENINGKDKNNDNEEINTVRVKECSNCKVKKPKEAFSKRQFKRKTGRRCKECSNQKNTNQGNIEISIKKQYLTYDDENNTIDFSKCNRYLFITTFTHLDFIYPEICSIYELQTNSKWNKDIMEGDYRNTAYLVLKLPNDGLAKAIANRLICTKLVIKIWTEDEDYAQIKPNLQKFYEENKQHFKENFTFRMSMHSFGRKNASDYKLEKFHLCQPEFLVQAKVQMNNPDYELYVCEDIGATHSLNKTYKRVYFGRYLCEGGRHLIDKFDVKKRNYIGRTSMDAELSLIMANHGKVFPNSLMIDPFCGTGSLLAVCAQFGADVLGYDLDIKVLRGNKNKTIKSNFEQYGLTDRFLGVVHCDHSQKNTWRNSEIFDAIVTDPPYGVREGARKVGFKARTLKKHNGKPPTKTVIDSLEEDHIPSCVPYPLINVLNDLVLFSAKTLRVGGRLVFWFPTTKNFKSGDLPMHPCFELVSTCEQGLSLQISRVLVTFQKIVPYDKNIHDIDMMEYNNFNDKKVSQQNFSAKYFKDDKRNDNRNDIKKKIVLDELNNNNNNNK